MSKTKTTAQKNAVANARFASCAIRSDNFANAYCEYQNAVATAMKVEARYNAEAKRKPFWAVSVQRLRKQHRLACNATGRAFTKTRNAARALADAYRKAGYRAVPPRTREWLSPNASINPRFIVRRPVLRRVGRR